MLKPGERASADNGGCAKASQPERDGGPDAASASGYQGNFAVQCVVHLLSVLNFRKLSLKASFSLIPGTFSPRRCLILQDTASCHVARKLISSNFNDPAAVLSCLRGEVWRGPRTMRMP